MAGLILGKAHEPGIGVCYVEHIAGDTFRLIPVNNPNSRLIRPRARVRWMRAKKKEASC